MADWYAIVRDADGVLLGYGTVLPDTLPPGSVLVGPTPDRQDQGFYWNTLTRAFDIPIPPPVLVDRLQDLAAHPYVSDVWSRLTPAQRVKLRKLIVWLLATHRFRQQLEETSLDPAEGWPTDPSVVVE